MNIFENLPLRLAADGPLYQQLYTQLRAAILAGRLAEGTRLPSTRALADELLISRNTVLNAYKQLAAEGYLDSTEGSGTYVADVLPDDALTAPSAQDRATANVGSSEPKALRLSQRAHAQLTSSRITPLLPPAANGRPRPFYLGMSALDAFPFPLWSRLIARRARQLTIGDLTYQDPAGYKPLREAIAAHVAITRRIRCTPDQVIVTSGAQGAFSLCAHMLVDPGDLVWMEDPGYIGARGALLGAGAIVVPVPIDHQGLMVDTAIERAPQARLVYTTPAHQFPLGVTMSLPRRLALLRWARRAGAYILEDDYDSEYRFAGRPLATLHGLDEAHRVIYIGSFSKILAPALRIGYLIVPPALVEPFLTVRRFVDFHLPTLEQAALADFIAEGHFARHLRRVRALFAQRRIALLAALRMVPLDVQASPVGSHCVGWLPTGIDCGQLVQEATAHGLNLWLVSQYSSEPLVRDGLLLGYGDHTETEMLEAVGRLAEVLQIVWPRPDTGEVDP